MVNYLAWHIYIVRTPLYVIFHFYLFIPNNVFETVVPLLNAHVLNDISSWGGFVSNVMVVEIIFLLYLYHEAIRYPYVCMLLLL